MGGGSLIPPPDLGSLRLANPSDILRIGIVATAGFKYSPVFRWERPYHDRFPEDTLLSYRSQFVDAVKSDDVIVLVQEDDYDPDETSKTSAIISPQNGWAPPESGEKVVVGVMTLKLEPGSKRTGELKDHTGSYPELPENPGRDLNRRHYDSWGSMVGSTRKEHCHGDSVLSMVVVHPAYWKRGTGTRLMKWARDLAQTDGVAMCTSSAPMSAPIFHALGFRHITEIKAEGDEDDPEGLRTELLEYTPEKTS